VNGASTVGSEITINAADIVGSLFDAVGADRPGHRFFGVVGSLGFRASTLPGRGGLTVVPQRGES